jgi:hypothetical protein
MSDPRYTDPRFSDQVRFSDPVMRRDDSVGGVWNWIAGLGAIALVVFLLIAGLNLNSQTAGNNPPANTGSIATHPMTPPSTTGQGSSTPRPLTPAPSRSGTQ